MSRKTADARLSALRAMPYEKYLLTPEWKERRKSAIDWARNACQLCNSKTKPLHVHHRTYDRLGAELPADLVVLCADCHAKFHEKSEEEADDEYPPLSVAESLEEINTNINTIDNWCRCMAISLGKMEPEPLRGLNHDRDVCLFFGFLEYIISFNLPNEITERLLLFRGRMAGLWLLGALGQHLPNTWSSLRIFLTEQGWITEEYAEEIDDAFERQEGEPVNVSND